MFFLLRAAFWLSLVILLIPADTSDSKDREAKHTVSTFEAVGAANSTWEDLRGFCGRNPSTCDTGRAVMDTYSAKAKAGARWVYDQLDEKDRTATGSTPTSTSTGAAGPDPASHPIARPDIRLPQPRPLG